MGNPLVDNPLLGPGLDRLRERRSVKWRLYDPDILPLWVAEMDVVPAEPIQRAVADAMQRGDTGYPWAADYAEALAVVRRRAVGLGAGPGAPCRSSPT